MRQKFNSFGAKITKVYIRTCLILGLKSGFYVHGIKVGKIVAWNCNKNQVDLNTSINNFFSMSCSVLSSHSSSQTYFGFVLNGKNNLHASSSSSSSFVFLPSTHHQLTKTNGFFR